MVRNKKAELATVIFVILAVMTVAAGSYFLNSGLTGLSVAGVGDCNCDGIRFVDFKASFNFTNGVNYSVKVEVFNDSESDSSQLIDSETINFSLLPQYSVDDNSGNNLGNLLIEEINETGLVLKFYNGSSGKLPADVKFKIRIVNLTDTNCSDDEYSTSHSESEEEESCYYTEISEEIHLSCSEPIEIGSVFDDFEVLDLDKILSGLDCSLPSVDLISPVNNSVINTSNVSLEYIVDDSNQSISFCELIVDGAVNQIDYSITEGVSQFFNVSLTAGNHNLSVNCTTSNGYESASEILDISTVTDNVPPVITLLSPLSGSEDANGLINFRYNVTDDSLINECNLIINEVINQTEFNVTTGTEQLFTLVNLTNGNYSWSINCTDANLNEGASGTNLVMVNIPPGVNQTTTILITETINTANDSFVSATVEYIDAGSQEVDFNTTGDIRNGTLSPGTYDILVTLQNHTIQEVLFVGVNLTSGNVSKLVDLDDPTGTGSFATALYAVDLSKTLFDFEYVNVTLTAQGRYLFKCVSWNYTLQVCPDHKWKRIKRLIPGKNYTFTLYNSLDPGFFEDNSSILVLDKDDFLVNNTQTIISQNGDLETVNITYVDYVVENMIVYDHNSSTFKDDLYLDDLNNSNFVEQYAVDPSGLDFSTANLAVDANLSSEILLKCKSWNFTTQNCTEDDWATFIRTINSTYTFTINSTDPGFGEVISGPENISDAYLKEGEADDNYGASDEIKVGGNLSEQDRYRSVIKFNLSYLPVGAVILDAQLQLYAHEVEHIPVSTTHSIHKIQQSPSRDWKELEVTWDDYNDTGAWTTGGGDYNSTATDSVVITNSSQDTWISFNVTDDVQNFIQGFNAGWLIKDSAELSEAEVEYQSSEEENVSLWPRLIINYTTDINSPNVTLISPLNNSMDDNGLVKFKYNVTDESLISSCDLILNGVVNLTDLGVQRNITQEFTKFGMPNGNYTWSVKCIDQAFNQDYSENRTIIVEIPAGSPANNITVNETIETFNGSGVYADVEYIDCGSQEIDFGLNGTVRSGDILPGSYNIRITLTNHSIHEVLFVCANITGNITKLIDVDDPSETAQFVSALYALDPSKTNFTYEYINVSLTAKGRSLYKCPAWNYTSQICSDNRWKRIKRLIPGQNYTITIYNSTDPGFGEDNSTINVLDKEDFLINNTQTQISQNGDLETVNITYVDHVVENMVVYDHNLSTFLDDLYLDDLNNSNFVEQYAVDASNLDFTTANVILTANSTSEILLKCNSWNFTTQNCTEDDWATFVRTINGTYTFTINSTDPGFGEVISGPENISDAYLKEGEADDNFGASDEIKVGGNLSLQERYRGIIQFNLSHISPGATVLNATLQLYVHEVENVPVSAINNLHKIQQSPSRDWKELEVTWNDYNDTGAWTTGGGDYNSTATDSVVITNSSQDTWISFNVTDDVQNFINNGSTNFGWLIKDAAELTDAEVEYRSSEHINVSTLPMLWVTVINQPPTHATPVLNSTFGTNTADEDLICYNQNTSDPEGDNVTNIYTFYKNGTTNKLFHLPFDNNLSDIFGDAPQLESGTSFMSGKFGRGVYVPDGAQLRYDSAGNINTSAGTVELWVNSQSDIWENGQNNHLFRYQVDADNIIFIMTQFNNYTRFHYEGTNDAQNLNLQESDAWNASEWHHLAMTWNSSAPIFKAYMDGVFVASGVSIQPFNNTGGYLWVGDYWATESDSIIDQFTIYDQVLSDAEISLHYNEVYNKILSNETGVGDVWMCEVTPSDGYLSGTTLQSNNLTILESDILPPNVNLNAPPDNYNTTNTTLNFNWTVTDNNDNSLSCDLIIDGIVNASNIISLNGTAVNYPVSGLGEGVHNWNVTCRDDFNNTNSSATWQWIIDLTAPAVTNIKAPNGTFYNYTVNNVSINATVIDNLVGVETVLARIETPNGSVIDLNLFDLGGNVYGSSFLTDNVVGIYNVTIIANDTLGNLNNTETTWFKLTSLGFLLDVVDRNYHKVNYTENIISNVSGIIDIEIFPENHEIVSLRIIAHSQESILNLIKIDQITANDDDFAQTFSIDLAGLNYTSANFTVTSDGKHLFKCVTFNWSTQRCSDTDDYNQTRVNLVVGQNYTFQYGLDPGFGITLEGPANTTDSRYRSGLPNNNYGGSTFLRVGRLTAGNVHRSIVRFNLSYLPSGINVTQANLSLYAYRIPGTDNVSVRTHGVHKVQQSPTRDWTELNVTWNSYNGSNVWTLAGGDFNALPTDTQVVSNLTLGSRVKYDITNDLNNFSDNPTLNFGWIVKDQSETVNNFRFDYRSSEHINPLLWPVLEIAYVDDQPPQVFDLIPMFNSSFNILNTIEISANVTDNIGVDAVMAQITMPNGTIQNLTLSNVAGDKYNNSFAFFNLTGQYNVTIIANDTSNLVNNTETTMFEVVVPPLLAAGYTCGVTVTPKVAEAGEEVLLQVDVSYTDGTPATTINITSANVSINKILGGNSTFISANNLIYLTPGIWYSEFNASYQADGNYMAVVNAVVNGDYSKILSCSEVFTISGRGNIDVEGVSPDLVNVNETVRLAAEVKFKGEAVSSTLITNATLFVQRINGSNQTFSPVVDDGIIYVDGSFNETGVHYLDWGLTYYNLSKTTREIVVVVDWGDKLDNLNVSVNFNASELVSLIRENRQYLLDLLVDMEYMQDFTEEEIFLITDSVNSMSKVINYLEDGEISEDEAQKQFNRIRDELTERLGDKITGSVITKDESKESRTIFQRLSEDWRQVMFILLLLIFSVLVVVVLLIVKVMQNNQIYEKTLVQKGPESGQWPLTQPKQQQSMKKVYIFDENKAVPEKVQEIPKTKIEKRRYQLLIGAIKQKFQRKNNSVGSGEELPKRYYQVLIEKIKRKIDSKKESSFTEENKTETFIK